MINSDVMEMYAAEGARGGVLEAAGIVEIKYRTKDLLATMHRIDPQLVVSMLCDALTPPPNRATASRSRRLIRWPSMSSSVRNCYCRFTPKSRLNSPISQAIRRVLQATQARGGPCLARPCRAQQASAALRDVVSPTAGRELDWSDDREEVETWLQQPGEIEPKVKQLRARVIEDKVKAMVRESPSEMCQAMMASFALLGPRSSGLQERAVSGRWSRPASLRLCCSPAGLGRSAPH